MNTLSDELLLERLRAGDESAFTHLLDAYGASMLHVARRYVKELATAEEMVQETWLAVLQGLPRFEGRSTLKSWIFSILVKRAITRGKRDARSVPFSSFANDELGRDEPAVAPERFAGPDAQWPRHWTDDLSPWSDLPEQRLLAAETRAYLEKAIAELPVAQRTVVTLRDVAGHSADEVAEQLSLSQGNVRVLLHRGRSKLRSALEMYFANPGDLAAEPNATALSATIPPEDTPHQHCRPYLNLPGRMDDSWRKNWIAKTWSKWLQTISKIHLRPTIVNA